MERCRQLSSVYSDNVSWQDHLTVLSDTPMRSMYSLSASLWLSKQVNQSIQRINSTVNIVNPDQVFTV